LPQKIRTVGEVHAVGPLQIDCQDLLFEAFIHPVLIQISRSFRKGFWQSHSWKDFHHLFCQAYKNTIKRKEKGGSGITVHGTNMFWFAFRVKTKPKRKSIFN